MTIEEVQSTLDRAVIMLNKRMLKEGMVMVMRARHELDEVKEKRHV